MSEQQPISPEQWATISQQLQEPFDPSEVDFRVQGRANEQTGRAQVVAYIDARVVQDRLDDVVGAGNWSFDWEPLVIDKGEVMIAKGILTIHGVSKSDAGSASNFEQTLGAVSHCFKRAAVHWGIGRYLYNLPSTWTQVEKGGRIPEQLLRELRAKLPRPSSSSSEGERVVDSPVEQKRGSRQSRPEPVVQPQVAAQVAPVAARNPVSGVPSAVADQPATEQQYVSIRKLCAALGKPEPETKLTYGEARQLITQLSGEYQRARRAS